MRPANGAMWLSSWRLAAARGRARWPARRPRCSTRTVRVYAGPAMRSAALAGVGCLGLALLGSGKIVCWGDLLWRAEEERLSLVPIEVPRGG